MQPVQPCGSPPTSIDDPAVARPATSLGRRSSGWHRLVLVGLLGVSSLTVGGASLADSGSNDPISLSPALPAQGVQTRSTATTLNGFTSVQVNVDFAGLNITGDAANEPTMAIDPTNPLNIVVGFRWFDDVGSNFRQAGYAYSHDGGLTWTHPGSFDPDFFRSDPILAADSSGRFYFQSISVSTAGLFGLHFPLDVWRSDDAGVTWSLLATSTFGGDRQTMAIDTTGGIGDGNLYMNWALSLDKCRACVGAECCGKPGTGACYIGNNEACTNEVCCDIGYFNRSADGGLTYEPRLVMSEEDPFSSPYASSIAVGPDGEIYSGDTHGPLVYSSRNASDPLSTPTFSSSSLPMSAGLARVNDANPGGDFGSLELEVDGSSGPRRGWVYAMQARRPVGGDDADLEFTRSSDGGNSWRPASLVRDDGAQDELQWFAGLSVAPNGRLDAVWLDTRGCSGLDHSQLVYSYSHDGGDTWSAEVEVGPCFNSKVGGPGGVQEFPLQPANNQKIGDYLWSLSDDQGATVAYPATYNNEQDVYFVRVFPDCNANQVSDIADIAGATETDVNGNHVPDSCEADFAGPTGSVSLESCTAFVSLAAADTGSGVVELLVSEDPAFSGALWEPLTDRLKVTAATCPATKTLYLKVRDGACRESSPSTITVSIP